MILDFKEDVWHKLARTLKPIVLYGTGNGADKILDTFDYYGIRASGVFASDGFVRDRSFRGMKVMSYTEAESRFGDFAAVIAFASSLDSVIDRMYHVASAHETFAPDVPVAGGALFDLDFFNEHKAELHEVRSLLSDEESAFIFDSVINYKISGDISYLREAVSDKDTVWADILCAARYNTYCDLGAYNGDTIRDFVMRSPHAAVIHAIEPDPRSFRKLAAFCENSGISARLYNAGAWSSPGRAAFRANGSRSSGIGKHGPATDIPLVTLDSVLGGSRADFIKYDVEGAEYEALSGSSETIKNHAPDLCVSLYHRSEDLFRLPLFIRSLNDRYKFYIRRFKYIPAWDLNLYCVKTIM